MLQRPDSPSGQHAPVSLGAVANDDHNSRRSILWGLVAILVLLALAWWLRPGLFLFSSPSTKAGGPAAVSVEVATAQRQALPVSIDAIGTVTPIASTAIKARLDSTIEAVHFEDGAKVKEGDRLFTLDGRQISAQTAQAESALARDRAQLAGAERDLNRIAALAGKGATSQVAADNARTQFEMLSAAVKAGQASLDNLAVQKSFTEIRAPIAGRVSAASVKVGNLVRPADATPLAIINQMSPIYVAFAIPQRQLADLRTAMAQGSARVSVTTGDSASESGEVAMIDNAVDPATGMVGVRGVMKNTNEALWPGALVPVTLTLREQTVVAVPTVAVQRSQRGDFVFIVKDGVASIVPVKVARTQQGLSVIEDGLSGGETVVTDGQMLLSEGSRVKPRGPRPEASATGTSQQGAK